MWSWPSYMGLQSLHPSCWEPHGGHSKLVWYLSKPRLHNINPILSINQYKEENPDSDVMRWAELTFMVARFVGERGWGRGEKEKEEEEEEQHGYWRKLSGEHVCFRDNDSFWVLVCWSVKNPFQSPSLLCYFVAANNGERERERIRDVSGGVWAQKLRGTQWALLPPPDQPLLLFLIYLTKLI